MLNAKTDYLDAQTRAQAERNHGREVAGHNIVRVIAVVVGAASLATWLVVVLTHGDEAAITAVSAVALVATNFATNVLTRGHSDKDAGDNGVPS